MESNFKEFTELANDVYIHISNVPGYSPGDVSNPFYSNYRTIGNVSFTTNTLENIEVFLYINEEQDCSFKFFSLRDDIEDMVDYNLINSFQPNVKEKLITQFENIFSSVKYNPERKIFVCNIIMIDPDTKIINSSGDFDIKGFRIEGNEENYDLYLHVNFKIVIRNEQLMILPVDGFFEDFMINSNSINNCLNYYDDETPLNEWVGVDEYENVPPEYADPITRSIMENPYTASDRQTYDLNTLIMMKEQAGGGPVISPITMQNLKEENGTLKLEENTALREEIEQHIYDNPEGNTYESNYYMIDPDLNPEGRMDMTGLTRDYMVDPDLNPHGRMDMTGSPLKYY